MRQPGIFGGFWRRGGAYLIDIVPITAFTAIAFCAAFPACRDAFGQFWQEGSQNIDVRREFLGWRNTIRNASLLMYVIFAGLMESCPIQATPGKYLFGLCATDAEGNRLSFVRAMQRNLAKPLSALPLGLGFVWIAFHREKCGWHDLIASTRVVRRSATLADHAQRPYQTARGQHRHDGIVAQAGE